MKSAKTRQNGVMTLATGEDRYITQAIVLARSVRMRNPGIPLAIVTDSTNRRLRNAFDITHTFRPELGGPFRQKLCVNQYSTFAQTLFVDSDCLIFRSLDSVFELLRTTSFCIPATMTSEGTWYRDVPGWLELLGAKSLPKLNSGCFVFSDTPNTAAFFQTALNYYDRLREFGIPQTHSGMSDEPAIAMALVAHDISCPVDDSSVQFSPLCGEIESSYSLLRGQLVCMKHDGRAVSPAILHCLAGEWGQTRYRREVLKLCWRTQCRIPVRVCDTLLDTWFCVRHGWRNRLKRLFAQRGKTPTEDTH